MFALMLATGALCQWSIDVGRHARECQHPADYLRHTYYENWLTGLEKLLVERGLVSAEELSKRQGRRTCRRGSARSRAERRTGPVHHRHGQSGRGYHRCAATLCRRRPGARAQSASDRPHP